MSQRADPLMGSPVFTAVLGRSNAGFVSHTRLCYSGMN